MRKPTAVLLFIGCGWLGPAALAGLAGCEYDARITVNPPDWAADPANAVQLVAVQPDGCLPSGLVTVAFPLGDDRDEAVVPGVELELTDGTVTVGESAVSADLIDVTLTPTAGGTSTPEGEFPLGGVAWRPGDPG